MKLNKKKLIISLVLIVIIALAILLYELIIKPNDSTTISKDGMIVNTSKKLSEDKKIDELVLKDIKLVQENGISKFVATIENNTNKDTDDFNLELVFVDKKGKSIETMYTYVKNLKPHEKFYLNIEAKLDYVTAYDIKLNKLKS